MQEIECSGSPYEIGYKHGHAASDAVARSIGFYDQLFRESSKLDWKQVLDNARQFDSTISRRWPRYYEEIKGVADGSGREVLEIVALNCRTEIVFGQMNDGCTSAYCHHGNQPAMQGQNWDWMPGQAANLLILTIHQDDYPTIKMVTEAGLIGKIGINSAGVGVCFNALRIKGICPENIPAHLALRCSLESSSAREAAAAIEEAGGLVSAAYILIGDKSEAIGIECTAKHLVRQTQTQQGIVVHANNLLFPNAHLGAQEDERWLRDSAARVARMNMMLSDLILPRDINGQYKNSSTQDFGKLFEDEQGYPMSICRAVGGESTTATLFNIVMDLEKPIAVVTRGRPIEKGGQYILEFGSMVKTHAARL